MRIFKKILKYLGITLGGLLAIVLALFIYFNWPIPDSAANTHAQLGVTFSARYASDIGLDWKAAYLAMLDDLGVREIRIPVYWDLVEKQEGQYDFSDIDWQLSEAAKRNAQVILTIGQKVPRWPECAIPTWAATSDQKRKESLLQYEAVVINRYKDNHPEIRYWQVENEPFLLFGVCPKPDASLLDSELAQTRKLDPTRRVIVSDSGELSLWMSAAKRADIFGTTMYRNVYSQRWGYHTYPIGPNFFRFKYWLIKTFVHQEKAIVIELQAEPWVSGYTTNTPLSEQFKSMNISQLKENVLYAEKTGFPQIYLWGVEWWYWMKTQKNHPELWDTAKAMFAAHQN